LRRVEREEGTGQEEEEIGGQVTPCVRQEDEADEDGFSRREEEPGLGSTSSTGTRMHIQIATLAAYYFVLTLLAV
jgi:hypothetical protein